MKALLSILLILQVVCFAQEKDLLFFTKGSVGMLYLTVAPEDGEHVKIFRSEGNGKEIEISSQKLLTAPTDMYEVISAIGPDFPALKKFIDAEEDYDVYLTIKGNGAKSGLVTLLFPSAAAAAGRMFTDSSVVFGRTYTYKLVYYSGSEEIGTFSKIVKVEKPVLNEPVKLTGELKGGLVSLQWKYVKWDENPTNFATNFGVYRKLGTGSFTKVNVKRILRNDAAEPFFSEATPGTTGFAEYYIVAIDPAGNESKPSVSVKIKLDSDVRPEAPEALTATPAAEGVKLIWNPSVSAGVTGYNLYRKETSAKDTVKVNKTLILDATPYFYDSSVTDGNMYLYFVVAVNKAGKQSQYSQMASALFEDKIPPFPASDLRLVLNKNFIKLDWKKSSSSDVIGYRIYRGGNKSIMTQIALANGTTFTDSGYQSYGFEAGKAYYYYISALDNSDNESTPTAVQEITYLDRVAPELPGQFYTRLSNNGKVDISIGNSSSLDVKLINIYRTSPGAKQKPKLLKTLTELPANIIDDSVKLSEKYFYQIELIDTVGNKSALLNSDTILVKDNTSPPMVPDIVAYQLKKGGVKIEFLGVIESDIAGYNIYRCKIANGIYEMLNSKPVKELEYTDQTGTTDYFYKVCAVDTSGNEGEPSEFVSVTIGEE